MQPDFHNEYARGTTCSTGGECAMWRILRRFFGLREKRCRDAFSRPWVLRRPLLARHADRITITWQTLG